MKICTKLIVVKSNVIMDLKSKYFIEFVIKMTVKVIKINNMYLTDVDIYLRIPIQAIDIEWSSVITHHLSK